MEKIILFAPLLGALIAGLAGKMHRRKGGASDTTRLLFWRRSCRGSIS